MSNIPGGNESAGGAGEFPEEGSAAEVLSQIQNRVALLGEDLSYVARGALRVLRAKVWVLERLARRAAPRVVSIPTLGPLPYRRHHSDAGADLRLRWSETLRPGEKRTLALSTRMVIPHGYVGLLLARSSLAVRGVFGHVGVIDAGYSGPLRLVVHNASDEVQVFAKGERVAQLLVLSLPGVEFFAAGDDWYEYTVQHSRGRQGFGSTGTI